MSQADLRRLDRLVGDGTSEAGIDLASLFRVILDQIQDNTDGVETAALTGPVMDAVSNHARVEHWYAVHAADPWAALITDALMQLESRRLIAQERGRWRTGPAFATGRRLTVIPARKGKHGSVGVIPRDAADREARGLADTQRMEIRSLAASLREDGPGLRPLDSAHVAALAQSMREYGYRPELPPLADQHGRILDGRHRIAAARRAGVTIPPPRTVKVTSDEEAVGFALLANLQRGLTRAERARVDSDLRAAGLTVENFGQQFGTAAARHDLVASSTRYSPDSSAHLEQHQKFDEQVNQLRAQGRTQRQIAGDLGVTFNRVQDSWQREEGRRQARAEMAREWEERAAVADNATEPLSRERGLGQIMRALLRMSPEDQPWALSELSAQVVSEDR